MQVKAGTLWTGADRNKFMVISVVEVEGNTWVYYRDDGVLDEPREYSCYADSFIIRFTPVVNEGKRYESPYCK